MRTEGAISNVSISFPTFLKIMGVQHVGPVFQGSIVISAKWLKMVMHPSEYEIVERGEKSVSEIVIGELGLKPVTKAGEKRPTFTAV